jgi:hypothetical protein
MGSHVCPTAAAVTAVTAVTATTMVPAPLELSLLVGRHLLMATATLRHRLRTATYIPKILCATVADPTEK